MNIMADLIKTTTRTMSVKHFSIHHNDRQYLVEDGVWSLVDEKGDLKALDPEQDKNLILFLEKKTKSVNLEKTKNNKYFVFQGSKDGVVFQRPKKDGETFKSHRDDIYNFFFRKTLDAQNERKRKSGHAKRVKTMDEFIKSSPIQETLLQVGNKSKSLKDEAIFEKICDEWIEENLLGKFDFKEGGIFPINVAFHYDETTIHAHVDWVGVARDKNGNWVMNKKQALRNLGYDVPKELETDTNNPTTLFSADIRKSFQDIVEKYTDFTVDRTPVKGSQHLQNGEYQEIMAEREKHANLIEEDKKLQEAIEAKAKELDARERELKKAEGSIRSAVSKVTGEEYFGYHSPEYVAEVFNEVCAEQTELIHSKAEEANNLFLQGEKFLNLAENAYLSVEERKQKAKLEEDASQKKQRSAELRKFDAMAEANSQQLNQQGSMSRDTTLMR